MKKNVIRMYTTRDISSKKTSLLHHDAQASKVLVYVREYITCTHTYTHSLSLSLTHSPTQMMYIPGREVLSFCEALSEPPNMTRAIGGTGVVSLLMKPRVGEKETGRDSRWEWGSEGEEKLTKD